MPPLTDVVKKLLILNVAIYFIATLFLKDTILLGMQTPFLFDQATGAISYNKGFQPFTMVTHMFMHSTAGMGHLLMNMMGLFFFGPYVERALGAKRFVILYFVAGFVAMFFHFGIDFITQDFSYVVGASGAISGVLFAFIMMFPDVKVMLLIPPIPMKAKYMAIIFFGIDLFRGLSGSNIAVFAHLGGAIAGIVLILLWRKSNFRF